MPTKTKPKRKAIGTARSRPTLPKRRWPMLPAVVPINTFAPEPFEVLRPLSVVIQPKDDDYLATFFDANINASGETQEEAFANLKDVLVSTFQMLDRMPESQLGPGPKRQRAVLSAFIRRTN